VAFSDGRLAETHFLLAPRRESPFSFAGITTIPVSALRWDDVLLDRTNGRWRA
jgi:5-methylcytosine-specific restriction enzyme subunit McrC